MNKELLIQKSLLYPAHVGGGGDDLQRILHRRTPVLLPLAKAGTERTLRFEGFYFKDKDGWITFLRGEAEPGF